MILNYTLKCALGIHNQKKQHQRMRDSETSKVKLYFPSSILYLMELQTSKTFKWNLWKKDFTLSLSYYTWRYCKEGIYLVYLGGGEKGRERRKSPQANLDSWAVFRARLFWRVVGVVEAMICYTVTIHVHYMERTRVRYTHM